MPFGNNLIFLVAPRSGCKTIVLRLFVCVSVRDDFKVA